MLKSEAYPPSTCVAELKLKQTHFEISELTGHTACPVVDRSRHLWPPASTRHSCGDLYFANVAVSSPRRRGILPPRSLTLCRTGQSASRRRTRTRTASIRSWGRKSKRARDSRSRDDGRQGACSSPSRNTATTTANQSWTASSSRSGYSWRGETRISVSSARPPRRFSGAAIDGAGKVGQMPARCASSLSTRTRPIVLWPLHIVLLAV